MFWKDKKEQVCQFISERNEEIVRDKELVKSSWRGYFNNILSCQGSEEL